VHLFCKTIENKLVTVLLMDKLYPHFTDYLHIIRRLLPSYKRIWCQRSSDVTTKVIHPTGVEWSGRCRWTRGM